MSKTYKIALGIFILFSPIILTLIMTGIMTGWNEAVVGISIGLGIVALVVCTTYAGLNLIDSD